ncbi:hypothetical protein NS258_12645 [Sphingomonas sanguinis]|uniref:Uncharacterized protein n=1 Tax=Sphingomonas sanguinis TaxID=33051 RepID=A0A147J6L4_9SPHN|nr:hypothetical protein NS258_12645 [Sphingomonas sanguinis]
MGDLGRHTSLRIGEAVAEAEFVHQLRGRASRDQILLIEQFDERALAQRAEQSACGDTVFKGCQKSSRSWGADTALRLPEIDPEISIEIDLCSVRDCFCGCDPARPDMRVERNMPLLKKTVERFTTS